MTDKEQLLSKDYTMLRLIAMTRESFGLLSVNESQVNHDAFLARTHLPLELQEELGLVLRLSLAYYSECRAHKTRYLKKIPKALCGNRLVYSLILSSMRKLFHTKVSHGENYTRANDAAFEAEKSNAVRNLFNIKTVRKSGSVFRDSESRDIFVKFQAEAFAIEEARDDAFKFFGSKLKGKKADDLEEGERPDINAHSFAKYSDITMNRRLAVFQLGTLIALRIDGKWAIMSVHHLRRYIEMLKTISHISLMMTKLSVRGKTQQVIENLIELTNELAIENAEKIGEYMKAARQMLMYDMEKSPIMSSNPKSDYLSTLDNDRAKGALRYYSMFKMNVTTLESAVNFANVYRSFLHPDTDLQQVFDSIKGFKNPNKMDPDREPRFRGVATRTLFKSLRETGYDVRLVASTADREAVELASMSMASYVPIDVMITKSYHAWSKVTFALGSRVPTAEGFEIKPGDKSSQKEGPGRIDELDELQNWSLSMEEEKPKSRYDYGTVNDIRSKLKGLDNLNRRKAVEKFKRIIKEHEQFEAKYVGVPIDDIPSEDLEKFLKTTESARTLVGTEPKLGEYHKEFTRMFYLAEQFMKAITQRVERLARLVSRKQNGVSIVKGYEGKQRDLERFCHAMTGPDGENRAVFVSFDLSEFSKKFPQSIVRIYGKLLSDLTGEDWLKRIDIMFRSAVVLHNTRGFFEYTAGVLGGFEGFLNFVWSSCHAVIMEIALESTGLKGELLTYSDDGLLYFIATRGVSKERIKRNVMAIKREYAAYGLEFNLKKTFISMMLWEYLGDVCVDSHLIPMFIKEAGAYGKNIRSKGVMTVAATFDQLIGQSRSLVKGGYSPISAYFLMRYYSHLKITRITNKLQANTIEAILITPRTCAGLRIPSALEMMTSSNISSDAEFIADLLLYSDISPNTSNIAINFVMKRIAPPDKALETVMLGTRFKTQGLKTSGMAVLNAMIDEILAESTEKITKHPLTPARKKRMKELLGCYDNIEPDIIAFFFQSLTEWDDYNRSLALVKSQSAREILGVRKIRKYQARDTDYVREALEVWNQIAREFYNTRVSPVTMVRQFSNQFLRELHLAPIKPSARTALVRVNHSYNSSIHVRFDHDKERLLTEQYYKEPCVKFSKTYSTLRWMSEDTTVSEISSARRLLDAIASIISYNPDGYSMLKSLASVFGVRIPMVPAGLLDNPVRRGVNNSKCADVSVYMPKVFYALSTSRYIGNTYIKVYDTPGIDRTTYLEMARCMAALEFDSNAIYSIRSRDGVMDYYYNIGESYFEIMHNTFAMERREDRHFHEDEDLVEMGEKIRTEFIASVMEHAQFRRHELIYDYANLQFVEEDSVAHLMMVESRRALLVSWVRSIATVRTPAVAPVKSVAISLIDRLEDIAYAIQVGCYHTLSNDTKKIISRALLRAKFKSAYAAVINGRAPVEMFNRHADGYEVVPDDFEQDNIEDAVLPEEIDLAEPMLRDDELDPMDLSHPLPEDYNEVTERAVGELLSVVNRVILAISATNSEDFPAGMVDHLGAFDIEKFKPLCDYLCTKTLISKSKIIITKAPSAAPGRFSGDYRTLYNDVYTNSITLLYGIANELKWDNVRISQVLPTITNIDRVLDIITVSRPILRKSSHRTPLKPANVKSQIISLLKFYAIIFREVNRLSGNAGGRVFDHRGYLRDGWESEIRYSVDGFVIGILDDRYAPVLDTFGPDHEAMLYTDLHESIKKRIMVKIKFFLTRRLVALMPHWEDLRNESHVFYQEIILPLTGRVVEIPTEVANLASLAPLTDEIITLSATHYAGMADRLSGVYILGNEIYDKKELSRLTAEMINYYTTTRGIHSVSGARDNNLGTRAIFDNKMYVSIDGVQVTGVEPRGGRRHGVLHKNNPDAGIEYVIIKSISSALALRNTLFLHLNCDGVQTTILDGNTFYTIFVGTGLEGAGFRHRNVEEVVPPPPGSEGLFVRKSLANEIKKFTSRAVVSANRSKQMDQSYTTALASSSYVRLQTHSYNQETLNIGVLAASRILQDSARPNARIAAYLLVKSELFNGFNPQEQIRDAFNARRNAVRNREVGSAERLEALKNDIAITAAWLSSASVPPTMSVPDRVVSEKIESVRDILNAPRDIFDVPVLVRLEKPRNISDVLLGRIEEPSDLITRFLYLAEIRAIEDDLDDDFVF